MTLRVWLSQAVTVFANGCLSGVGGGSVAGAGTGMIASSSVGEGQSAEHKMIAAFGAAILCAVGNGIKRVLVWHDANPIPTLFEPREAQAVPETSQVTPSGTFDKITPS